MANSKLQLREIANVAASSTALINIPIGPRYKYIVIEHGFSAGTNTVAGAASNIAEARVKVNGRAQRTYSGTQLRDLLLLQGTRYDGQGAPNTAPGVAFPIFFEEPWRPENGYFRNLAWATSAWASFQIELDLGAATSPTVQAFAIVDDVKADENESIMKVIRQSFAASGTSQDFPSVDRRDLLCKVSLYKDSGGSQQATKITARLNSQIVYEMEDSTLFAANTHYGLTPTASGRTAGMTDVVFDNAEFFDEALNLNGSRDFTITVNAGSAMSGTITSLIQRLGPLE